MKPEIYRIHKNTIRHQTPPRSTSSFLSLSPRDKLNSETLVAWLLLKALRFNVLKGAFSGCPRPNVWCEYWRPKDSITWEKLLIWSWSHDQPNLPPHMFFQKKNEGRSSSTIIWDLHTYQVICSPNVHIERDDLKEKRNWSIFQPLIFQGG